MNNDVIVFSFDSMDENLGLWVSETDDEIVCNNVVTLLKQQDERGNMSVNTIPFAFNSTGLKEIHIIKKHLKWYSKDMDPSIKTKYLASVSGIIVADSTSMKNLEKNNVVPFHK